MHWSHIHGKLYHAAFLFSRIAIHVLCTKRRHWIFLIWTGHNFTSNFCSLFSWRYFLLIHPFWCSNIISCPIQNQSVFLVQFSFSLPQNYKKKKKCLVAKSCPTLVIPWTVAHQVPLSMGFSRQEYWRGLPSPSPGDLPDPGIKPRYSA